MSTHSFIAKQIGPDKYRGIYCHHDGYLTHNGAMLVDHYSSPERVDKLLDMGDISGLREKVDPDPSRPHGFEPDKQQPDVTVAYGRDYGEKGTQAILLTTKQLEQVSETHAYTYVFTEEAKWKYCRAGEIQQGLKDVKQALDELYDGYGRPEGYYGTMVGAFANGLLPRHQPPAYTGPVYRDKNGVQILPGMQLRFPDGSVEKVYATMDSEGKPDLGINASNEAYMRNHGVPEAEREFYSLASVGVRDAEVCEQKIQQGLNMQM